MDQQIKDIINEKIKELEALAEVHNAPMLLIFSVADEPGGMHLSAAGGSALEVQEIVVKAAKHNDVFKKVMKLTASELFGKRPLELSQCN